MALPVREQSFKLLLKLIAVGLNLLLKMSQTMAVGTGGSPQVDDEARALKELEKQIDHVN